MKDEGKTQGQFLSENQSLRRNITERRLAEEKIESLEARLLQAHKMEAIGMLAGGIVHDINNILTPIIICTELALDKITKKSPARADLDIVLKAAHRAKKLVQQILVFSRREGQACEPVEMQAVVREAIELIKSALPAKISIKQRIGKGCGKVLANPTQIYQVLMNLCANAFHAMESGGGIIEVTLDEVQVDGELVRKHLNLGEGRYMRLIVSDTGHGMDSKTMERIFDPFFTTKKENKGTGLGLYVVHGIVTSCGGEIAAESKPGRGTAFTIYLPKIELGKEGETQREAPTLSPSKGNILYVDDDEDILFTGKGILNRRGYKVTAMPRSVEALEAFRINPQGYDLVITDYSMPWMTGITLSQIFKEIRPDLPIILTTSYSDSISAEDLKRYGIHECIEKPFFAEDLCAVIGKVMDGKERRKGRS